MVSFQGFPFFPLLTPGTKLRSLTTVRVIFHEVDERGLERWSHHYPQATLVLWADQSGIHARPLDMSHLEEYTQMYYSLSIRGWKVVGTDRQVEVQRSNPALSGPITHCYSWVSAPCRRLLCLKKLCFYPSFMEISMRWWIPLWFVCINYVAAANSWLA